MNSTAFIKMVLHAAKYPHCSVNGVFLQKKLKDVDHSVNIKDSIPLFHLNLTLLPMLEVALSEIEVYCSENNLVIGGYYHIHNNIHDDRPDAFVNKLMERLKENCGKACLFMVDNSKLNLKGKDGPPYTVYEYKDGKLVTGPSVSVEAGASELALRSIENGEYQQLTDFDNHLDNISLDWRNQHLVW